VTQRIEILSATVHTKTGTSKKGKEYRIREQDAVLHDTGKKYPQECRVLVPDDMEPFAPGVYDIGSPFSIGQFDSLQVNRGLGLVLVKKAA
jgi:hypothetical protein